MLQLLIYLQKEQVAVILLIRFVYVLPQYIGISQVL